MPNIYRIDRHGRPVVMKLYLSIALLVGMMIMLIIAFFTVPLPQLPA